MTGRELLRELERLTEEQLSLQVVTSDDKEDGFNFLANNVEVGNVACFDSVEEEEVGPYIIIVP